MHTSAHAPIGSRRAAHLSAHAKFVNCDHGSQMKEQSTRERLGQCNFGIPRTLKNHWRLVQGGVVDWFGGLGQWGRIESPVIECRQLSKLRKCIACECLLSLHGSGAGSVLLIRYPCSWL